MQIYLDCKNMKKYGLKFRETNDALNTGQGKMFCKCNKTIILSPLDLFGLLYQTNSNLVESKYVGRIETNPMLPKTREIMVAHRQHLILNVSEFGTLLMQNFPVSI